MLFGVRKDQMLVFSVQEAAICSYADKGGDGKGLEKCKELLRLEKPKNGSFKVLDERFLRWCACTSTCGKYIYIALSNLYFCYIYKLEFVTVGSKSMTAEEEEKLIQVAEPFRVP